jgi:hypothetical protein
MVLMLYGYSNPLDCKTKGLKKRATLFSSASAFGIAALV